MDKLCTNYGPLIGTLDSKPYYDMPSPVVLTKPGVEGQLRQLGFGYRAKYLHQTALMLTQDHEEDWLNTLRNPESPAFGFKTGNAGEMLPEGRPGYREAHEALLSLQGVGPKVADCICLMGLGWGEAVPVDTHGMRIVYLLKSFVANEFFPNSVWQIAQRDYKFGRGKHSSLTKATYDAVGNKFRSLWGKEAGWAHSVLFTADLRAFSERLSTKTEEAIVKEEEITSIVTETEVKAGTLTPISIKRENEETEPSGSFVESIRSTRTIKRQRRNKT